MEAELIQLLVIGDVLNYPKLNILEKEMATHSSIPFFFHFLILFFNFTILYWFCHISTWICHRYIRVPHPEPSSSSLPVLSLWVVPVYQPQASSIVHQTWTGDSFHIGGEGEGGMISENGIETFQYSCLENSVDRRAWWAALHGVAQSQTWLKRLSIHACIGEGNGNPIHYSCLKNPRDRGAWWAAVHGVAQSRTRLKRLSISSSKLNI